MRSPTLEWRSAPVNSNSVAPSTAAIEVIAARRSKFPSPSPGRSDGDDTALPADPSKAGADRSEGGGSHSPSASAEASKSWQTTPR